jgi:AraC-like DNA-binding protein
MLRASSWHQSLSSGNCSKQRVVVEMGMSPSTLQQKLALRDSSFQGLLNGVWQSLTRAYKEQARISITERSFLQGFNDPGSFTRAFRRWTGNLLSVEFLTVWQDPEDDPAQAALYFAYLVYAINQPLAGIWHEPLICHHQQAVVRR